MRASSDRSVQPYNSRSQTLAFEWYLRALRGGTLNEPQYPAPERVLPAGVRISNFRALVRLADLQISVLSSRYIADHCRSALGTGQNLSGGQNGKSTGTHAKATCARESHDRPPRPGRLQAKAG